MMLLKNQWILAKVVEIEGTQLGDPDCILVEPMIIDGTNLKDWLPFADEKETVVRSSDIITFVEPGKDLLSKYYGYKPEVLSE